MDYNQVKLLQEIMEVGFALIETNLYLDTHPTDERALMLHNTHSRKYNDLYNRYSSKYGPLTYTGMSRCPWEYIQGPWPWEIEYEKCHWD
ncbi:spore coat protein CotJB [Clostridium sp. D2Q-14]|uniref:spore coat protein CotJB n=1 Tax=Anaeromonas gelatinilytica TaxID=2683194 RepID=UPI00193B043A|nr:spore coat protein CotJB [Anaeromonas gelatinilytica]MBS4534139.1 spore coat protein CotJB [Anaeromonas gelatinilytica]